MTVSTQTTKITVLANGATTIFSYNFQINTQADADLYLIDSTGSVIALAQSTWSMTGAGNPAGGTFTYPLSGSALASGYSLVLARDMPYTQTTNLSNQGTYLPAAVEGGLDNIVLEMQQVSERIGRSLQFPITDPSRTAITPTWQQRVNKLLGFDSAGNVVVYDVPGAGTSLTGNASLATVIATTSSTARTLAERFHDIPNVRDYGALNDGTTDASAAIQTALNLVFSIGGGTLLMPAGRYKLLSDLSLPVGVTLEGVGPGTVLVLSTANMIGIKQINGTETNSNIGVRNLAIEQAAANTTGISFRLCRFTDIDSVTFWGVSTCFILDRGKSHSLRHLRSIGTASYAAGGAVITSLSDTDDCQNVTMSDFLIFNQGTGSPSVGLFIRRGVNVSVSDYQCYGTTGMIAAVAENGCEVVKIVRMVTAGCAAGLLIQQGSGVATVPIYVTLRDSHIDQASAYGVRNTGGLYTVLDGVGFTAIPATNNVPAIQAIGVTDMSILGCHAEGLTGANGTFLLLSGTASDQIAAQNCAVRNCTTGVNIQIASTNVAVKNNSFAIVTNPYAGTIGGAGNVFRGNIGLNPVTIGTAAVPASTTTLTNGSGADLRVYINGGTNVSVRINGLLVTTGLTSSSCIWLVGETLRLDYTVAPTWVWSGM